MHQSGVRSGGPGTSPQSAFCTRTSSSRDTSCAEEAASRNVRTADRFRPAPGPHVACRFLESSEQVLKIFSPINLPLKDRRPQLRSSSRVARAKRARLSTGKLPLVHPSSKCRPAEPWTPLPAQPCASRRAATSERSRCASAKRRERRIAGTEATRLQRAPPASHPPVRHAPTNPDVKKTV